MGLSEQEREQMRELLIKMGVSPDKLLSPKAPRKTVPAYQRPTTISLKEQSAKIKVSCLCCKKDSEKFIDYTPKDGEEGGYAVSYVKKPSYKVTRFHAYDVIMCEHCFDLEKKSKEELKEMVLSMRQAYVRKLQ